MQLLNLDTVGARQRPHTKIVEFGVYLPWIDSAKGYEVAVKIIHHKDQFIHDVLPLEFSMQHVSTHSNYGAYWNCIVDIASVSPPDNSRGWGDSGQYVYRFEVVDKHSKAVVDWVIDPFAREFGVGKMSSFTLDYTPYTWSPGESSWKTPRLRDIVVYELHLGEFANGIDGATSRLDYLADLGVNCIEVMPVSNVIENVNWGFQPIGYFGVDDRFGNRWAMQRFIDKAHEYGLAVILDVVFGHTGSNFPYSYLYRSLGFGNNPFHWSCFGKDFGFGERTNWCDAYVQDFFFTVCHHWLDCYHVDGFRYDCVPEIWDPGMMRGYHCLAYETYNLAASKVSSGEWKRFGSDGGSLNLIQCAEQLEFPVEAVRDTYGNSTWCGWTMDSAAAVAKAAGGDSKAIIGLGLNLGIYEFPRHVVMNGKGFDKSVFQYIESHDASRFVNYFGQSRSFAGGQSKDEYFLFPMGDRQKWFKVQPYLIALLLADGIPMLWQGQELCENNSLPSNGEGRVGFLRPVNWDYFYDTQGRSTLCLVRKLLALRKHNMQFRWGDYYFYGEIHSYVSQGLLVYKRTLKDVESIVFVNFTGDDVRTTFSFSHDGKYKEFLNSGKHDLVGVVAGQPHALVVPSNYGCVWTNT